MSAEMQCAMFFVWKSSYHCRWMGHIVVYKSLVKTLRCLRVHYNDVMMSAMASHIICVSSVCSTVCSGADQGKHQSRSTSLAFVREIHWWPVDSPHKGPVSWEIFPFDDVVMWFMLFFSHCRMFCISYHDDVIKWKHFPRNWPFVREIHRSPVNFPHKGQWRGALMFSLIYAWINDWVNNHEAGDLRRKHGHYDVIVMSYHIGPCFNETAL